MERFKKTQIIAAIVTILLHLGVLLLLLNIYLKREIPQDEEGLEVMFGMSDNGGNDYFEPTPAEEIAEQLAEPTPPEQSVTPSDEAYQTQDLEESVHMKKQKTEEELKKEKELAEKKRRVILALAQDEIDDDVMEEICKMVNAKKGDK